MIPPIPDLIRDRASPLPSITDPSFGSHYEPFGFRRLVLLGDGSHGTSEYYAARAEASKYLIQHHNFKVIAFEADYPDMEIVDRYVRQRPEDKSDPLTAETPFLRFPTWMWRNKEMQDFVHWLRDWNASRPPHDRVGVFGLDLYSMGRSMEAVLKYLQGVDPDMARKATKRYRCLEPFMEEPQEYGLMALHNDMSRCEQGVLQVCKDLLAQRLEYGARRNDGEEFHSSFQNAKVAEDAAAYYRAMYRGSARSWNLRDEHMFGTLERLLEFKGKGTKAIVWAHNSHLGDARFTEMGKRRRELNIGQLVRQKYGDDAALIGHLSHAGTVAAADDWDGDMEIKDVVPSRPDSVERLMHDAGTPSFLLDLRREKLGEALYHELLRDRIERFIGVIYRPNTEMISHYAKVSLPRQFDALVWFDESKAVGALEKEQPHTSKYFEATYPFAE